MEIRKETMKAAEDYLNSEKVRNTRNWIVMGGSLCAEVVTSAIIFNITPVPKKPLMKLVYAVGLGVLSCTVANIADREFGECLDGTIKTMYIFKAKFEEAKNSEPDVTIVDD